MSFHEKQSKPLSNTPIAMTSNLQKSQLRDSRVKNIDSQSPANSIQSKQKLTQYGHDLGKVPVSYRSTSIQTKLTIGQPGDKYEREADKVAAKVMSMSQPVQRQEIIEEEEELQPKPAIQRKEMTEEEELQPKSSENNLTANTETLEQQLNSSKGGGSSLSDGVRSFMEPRFGTDFGNVKIHTDSNAVQMNQSIQAQAFTHGGDIYFNSGKYSPDTNEGKSLLAHELTHVVQQQGGE